MNNAHWRTAARALLMVAAVSYAGDTSAADIPPGGYWATRVDVTTMCGMSGKTSADCRLRVSGLPRCQFNEYGVTNGVDYIFRPPNAGARVPVWDQWFESNAYDIIFPRAHEIWCRNGAVTTTFFARPGEDGFMMEMTPPPPPPSLEHYTWTVHGSMDVQLFDNGIVIPAGLGSFRIERRQPDGSWVTLGTTRMGKLVWHGDMAGNTAHIEVVVQHAGPGKYRAAFRVDRSGAEPPAWTMNLVSARFEARLAPRD